MRRFNVGDRVVCVNDKGARERGIVRDREYIISNIFETNHKSYVYVDVITLEGRAERWIYAERFEKVASPGDKALQLLKDYAKISAKDWNEARENLLKRLET